MTRMVLGALLLLAASAAGCEDNAEDDGSCEENTDCERGQICKDEVCVRQECMGVGDCAGSGVACLAFLHTCSVKECAGDGLGCAVPTMCVESGPYRGSCVEAPISCGEDAQCADLGSTFGCCGGICTDQCPDSGLLPVGDANPAHDAATGDAGVAPDAAPTPRADAGSVRPCSPCNVHEDCHPLGPGAECTRMGENDYCTSGCDPEASDCAEGYRCVPGLNQCVPLPVTCGGCLLEPCPAGEICDYMTQECIVLQDRCGPCLGEESCLDGLQCSALEAAGRSFCLPPCADGQCADGFTCDNGACSPPNGRCDACGGTCQAPTPACHAASGRCVECDSGAFACEAPLSCSGDGVCRDGGGEGPCDDDADCVQFPDRKICFLGRCVACLQDSDCQARHACNLETYECESSPCRGVSCHGGMQCNPDTGRCDPGCAGPEDCIEAEPMGCNADTGQCYFLDGRCDPGGTEGVCAPGAECVPSLFGGNVCTCTKSDPYDAFEPPEQHLVGCHPGLTCLQIAFPAEPDPNDPNDPGEGVVLPGSCVDM